jgi:hypothetical protein
MAASQRVTYAEGQRIGAGDLTSEQLYLLSLDERHNLGEHAPGVALGLTPSTDRSGEAIITAGVAIDEDGRELLSKSDVPAPALAGAQCVDLWIVYCLLPLEPRRPGIYDCSPGNSSRSREIGQIVASAADAASEPVPPYERAVYLGRIECAETQDLDYVALMGQRVADPGARAVMQIGPASGHDRYGFLITSVDGNGASHPKLAIDRQRTNTFWGEVNLLGYQADALLPSPVAGFLLKAMSGIPGDFGEQIRVRLTPLGDQGTHSALGLTLLYRGRPISKMVRLSGAARDVGNQLKEFNRASKLVRLELVEHPENDEQKGIEASSEKLLTTQDIPLSATGGGLELHKWPDPPAAAQVDSRGCASPIAQDEPTQLANGISFAPPDQPVKLTPLPGASAVAISDNGAQVTQLRLDLGKKKDNDPFLRLAIGAPDQNDDFQPWLVADGIGNLSHAPKKGALINLNVTGRVEQGPIQPDPTDPRFTALLVLAWLNGLESSVQASTVVSLAISGLPALIETNQPWQYKVTATNSGSVAVTADKLFEIRTIAGQTLLTNIANQTVIAAGASQDFNISHAAGEMSVTGDLSIEVRMSGKIGNFPWWKAKTTGPIPVVPSPGLDVSDLPSSAPPDADFDHQFTITNTANTALHLNSVTVTEGNGAPRQLTIGAADLPQNGQAAFGPVSHPGGINAELAVQISIDFTWANGPASNVTANKTIKSLLDLEIDVQNIIHPIAQKAAWFYDLVLTNVGNQTLAIPQAHGLQQCLSSPDFPTTPWVDIPLGGDINLKPNQSYSLTGVAATVVRAATNDITLNIQPTYQRENRNWNPDPTTKDIHLP